MVTVYVNNRPVILTEKLSEVDSLPFRKYKFVNKRWLDQQIELFEEKPTELGMIIFHYDLDELFYYFRRVCKYIKAAGGLVKNRSGKYLFIYRKGKWDIPKGKMEGDENPSDCAIREIQEECGLPEMTVVGLLTSTYHTYWQGGKRYLKKTYWYRMESNYMGPLKPQLEEQITSVKWLTEAEMDVVRKNTFKSVLEVIEQTLA